MLQRIPLEIGYLRAPESLKVIGSSEKEPFICAPCKCSTVLEPNRQLAVNGASREVRLKLKERRWLVSEKANLAGCLH